MLSPSRLSREGAGRANRATAAHRLPAMMAPRDASCCWSIQGPGFPLARMAYKEGEPKKRALAGRDRVGDSPKG